MTQALLVRFFDPENGVRAGIWRDDFVYDLTPLIGTIAAWLQASAGQVDAAVAELMAAATPDSARRYRAAGLNNPPAPDVPHWLPPVDLQDIWAADVTYENNLDFLRQTASDGGEVYNRVFSAVRPGYFFKARGAWAVGPLAEVGIRGDARWSVPEPELTLLLNPALEVVGLTIGNDLTGRDLEGENPLYIPQAKIYTDACALGPGVLLCTSHEAQSLKIQMQVERGGVTVFAGQTETSQMHRSIADLISHLGRAMRFPDGVLLMTGTGIIAPADFSLLAGDRISITIDRIGTLQNTVRVI